MSQRPNPPHTYRGRKHRLKEEAYLGTLRYAFTICVERRQKYFTSQERIAPFVEALYRALERDACDADIYLFMPDHVHLVLTGREAASNLARCVEGFKQFSGYRQSQLGDSFKWQKGSFDSFIRSEEEYRNHLNYILLNPVRGELVSSWKEYDLWGSTVYDKRILRGEVDSVP